MSERRCGFDGCQAGGVILPPPAPVVSEVVNHAYSKAHTPILVEHSYHPGCWAAEKRRASEAPFALDVGRIIDFSGAL